MSVLYYWSMIYRIMVKGRETGGEKREEKKGFGMFWSQVKIIQPSESELIHEQYKEDVYFFLLLMYLCSSIGIIMGFDLI